jgi:glycosyltransferase involved in cell wall biosynthesis
LFAVRDTESWERGVFDPEALPFPATRLEFGLRDFDAKNLPARMRTEIDAWSPDVVWLGDAFFLKPYLALALKHYPLASRYYAYEAVCHRSIQSFRGGASCQYNYLDNPKVCRICALEALAPEIKQQHHTAWVREYIAAQAYQPEYHKIVCEAWKVIRALVVSNALMAEQLKSCGPRSFIIPGAVDIAQFPFAPPDESVPAPKIILMCGRAEDPVKGASVLREAGERLRRDRSDFEIRVTMPEDTTGTEWFHPVGWRNHDETRALYREADICVVPSIWEEPFGLVAVEAMATGRAVVASKVGGLAEIVVDGETGVLVPPNDPGGLAAAFARLLDDPALCRRMGEAGRRRVEANYSWDRVVAEHYPPVLAYLQGGG